MEGEPDDEDHDQNELGYQSVPAILPYTTQPYPPQQTEYYPKDVLPPYPEYNRDVPDPYSEQIQPVQQQSSTNVVMVQQQPTAVFTQTAPHGAGDNYLTLSILLTILCFLCCTWYSLLCTIPAIFLASAARGAERRGDLVGAREKRNAALICNITACVWWVIAFLIIVIPLAVMSNISSYRCHYHNYSKECYSSK